MMVIYTIDASGFYAGPFPVTDQMAPVPFGVGVPPPALQGDEVARWSGAGWDVLPSMPVITLTPEQIVANTTAAEAKRIASLWQAAHDYEFAQVSGSAIGLLAMGVLQGLPKCIAVQNWIKSIWSVYYTRKAGTSTDTDFSIAGQCPHSVPELMVELGF